MKNNINPFNYSVNVSGWRVYNLQPSWQDTNVTRHLTNMNELIDQCTMYLVQENSMYHNISAAIAEPHNRHIRPAAVEDELHVYTNVINDKETAPYYEDIRSSPLKVEVKYEKGGHY